MARTEARIFSSVWSDTDWRKLSPGAQWLYWTVLSQPELSMCGVLTTAIDRWANLAAGLKAKTVASWLAELHDGRFVVHDRATAEVWVRAFLRRDGVLRTPNFVVAMARAFEEVHSDDIRAGIVRELRREFTDDIPQGVLERFPQGFKHGLAQRFPKGFLDAVHGPCTHVRAPHQVTEITEVTESPPSVGSETHPAVVDEPGLPAGVGSAETFAEEHEQITGNRRRKRQAHEIADRVMAERSPRPTNRGRLYELVDERLACGWDAEPLVTACLTAKALTPGAIEFAYSQATGTNGGPNRDPLAGIKAALER